MPVRSSYSHGTWDGWPRARGRAPCGYGRPKARLGGARKKGSPGQEPLETGEPSLRSETPRQTLGSRRARHAGKREGSAAYWPSSFLAAASSKARLSPYLRQKGKVFQLALPCPAVGSREEGSFAHCGELRITSARIPRSSAFADFNLDVLVRQAHHKLRRGSGQGSIWQKGAGGQVRQRAKKLGPTRGKRSQ